MTINHPTEISARANRLRRLTPAPLHRGTRYRGQRVRAPCDRERGVGHRGIRRLHEVLAERYPTRLLHLFRWRMEQRAVRRACRRKQHSRHNADAAAPTSGTAGESAASDAVMSGPFFRAVGPPPTSPRWRVDSPSLARRSVCDEGTPAYISLHDRVAIVISVSLFIILVISAVVTLVSRKRNETPADPIPARNPGHPRRWHPPRRSTAETATAEQPPVVGAGG